MGMGEPLDNYSNVVEACRALIDRQRWNLAHGRVTVSTVGLVSQIRKLTAELPEVSLALSLHAPNQQDRQAIVPTAKHYPLEDLIDALDQHMMAYLQKRTNRGNGTSGSSRHYTAAERIKESTRRRAMIEYVMLEGPTSTLECAHQLGKLCENRHLVVNLIPYNQTNVRDVLRCPSREHMEEFREIVVSYGSFCTIRKTMGADIDSACGQLITLRENKQSQNEHNAKGDVKDIEDGGSGCGGGTKQQALATSSGGSVRRKVEVAEVLGKGQLSDHSACSHTEQGVNLEAWIRPLALATTLAGSCFMISIALAIRQRRRQ
jgi:sorting nexin-8